jgi:hypothetical protein
MRYASDRTRKHAADETEIHFICSSPELVTTSYDYRTPSVHSVYLVYHFCINSELISAGALIV